MVVLVKNFTLKGRTMKIWLVFAVAFFASALCFAGADQSERESSGPEETEQLVPTQKFDDGSTLRIWGYSRAEYDLGRGVNKFGLENSGIFAIYTHGKWRAFMEADVGQCARYGGNCILQGWLSHKFDNGIIFRGGRFKTAAAKAMHTASYDRDTITDPMGQFWDGASVFGMYTTGVQLKIPFSKDWTLTADFGSATNADAFSRESWTSPQGSLKLSWHPRDDINLSLVSQFQSDFSAHALSLHYVPTESLEFAAALWEKNVRNATYYGGYVQSVYQIAPWVSVHANVVRQQGNPEVGGATIPTVGVEFLDTALQRHDSMTVDFSHVFPDVNKLQMEDNRVQVELLILY